MFRRARLTLLPLALAAAASAAESRTTLPKASPFESPNQPAAATAQAKETIEFAGVSAIGKRTDYIFYDKNAKKSHWIAKGETKEGITVLNYDDAREEVRVKVNGAEKVLALRKPAIAGNAPRPVPALATGFNVPTSPPPLPGAAELVQKIQPPPPGNVEPAVTAAAPATPATPATPEAQAQQKAETEARMLVSDLLEIGMAQRKAYEEAQRRAAQGGEPQAAAPAQPGAPASDVPANPPAPAR